MMVRLADTGEVHAVDYREKAPAASTPTMLLGADGEVDREKSGVGHLVIGVPGTVRGFWEASQRFGALEWAELVEPAVTLARDGFVVDEYLSNSLKRQERSMDRFPEFGLAYRKEDGSYYEPGERMVLPDLAWTLEQIRDNGTDGFYRGEVAERLVDHLQAHGGIITLEDLAAYAAPIREPTHGTYRGYEVYGMPPRAPAERPSSRSSTCSRTTTSAAGSAGMPGRSTCWPKRCASGSTPGEVSRRRGFRGRRCHAPHLEGIRRALRVANRPGSGHGQQRTGRGHHHAR